MDSAPPITQVEVDLALNEMERLKLPVARLIVDDHAIPGPLDTKFGGRPWQASDNDVLPVSADGQPIIFLAQINFAQIAPLADFPDVGLLQLFFDPYSLDYDDLEHGFKHKARWFPQAAGDRELSMPTGLPKVKSVNNPFVSHSAFETGLAFRIEHAILKPSSYVLPISKMTDFLYALRHPENDEVRAILEGWEERDEELRNAYGTHWIGGHPSFVQDDIRYETKLADLDRFLLHVGCDDNIMFGDAGEGNLMIRRDDLMNRRFDRTFYAWDCS